MNNFIDELRRRNVFRVAGVYAVAGWVLAQISTTLEEALGLPAWFDATIVAVLLLGLPIALILAWAFELTPDGVLRTEDVPLDDSVTRQTGRKLDYVIIGGLAILGVVLLWQELREQDAVPGLATAYTQAVAAEPHQQAIDKNTIAVLPFDDLSPEGDQEYFSDGIAEEILNVLVRVNGLRVSSRTSSFQFKNRNLGIPEIAAELKVRHVVEGSVRKAGGTIRITAQLIDAADDKHIWSETFDRPLSAENIFVIQDEIANAIVVALSESLGLTSDTGVKVTAMTDDLGAYELFLRARSLFNARLRLDEVEILIGRIVELDPEFAKAWEIRAALPALLNEYGYTDTSFDEVIRQTTEYADRALELDPTRATAIAAKAMVRSTAVEMLLAQYDYAEILAEFDRALAIEPGNTSALNWRGNSHHFVGNLDAALRDHKTCVDLDPYYVPCVENWLAGLMLQGRDAESLLAYKDALNQGLVKLEYAPFPALARLGEELAFKSAMNHPGLLLGWRQHDELYNAYRDLSGDHSALAESVLNFGDSLVEIDPSVIRSIALPLGAHDLLPVAYFLWDESSKYYRRSPQFKAYIKESGVLDYWQQQGFPRQCRATGADDFECD